MPWFFSDVNSGTGELLLEVHDRATKRFLGLGLVGMEELLINPNQRQTITLQPRPYETDPVAGTLTVEVCIFYFSGGNCTAFLSHTSLFIAFLRF